WAVTLVNMRQPKVLEAVLKSHGAELAATGAFANGFSSSAIMRYDTTPDAPFITKFCKHQPGASDPALVQLWNSQVTEPCQAALKDYYPVLQATRSLGELFRYQSLSDLVARLKGQNHGGRPPPRVSEARPQRAPR